MQTIAISVQKGGVGKTATAATLSQAGAYKGKRVLAIDLDPQGNLSFTLGADTSHGTSLELLHGENPEDLIQEVNGISVIPASWELSAEKISKGSATRLKKALEPLQGEFDYCFIDTPPTAGEMQYNALYCSDSVIIPAKSDAYSLQGLYQISATIEQIKQANKLLEVKGFILTMLDNRSILSREMQEKIIIVANKLKIPYLGSVRNGIVVQEAAALQANLYEYAPESNPAKDYLELFGRL